MADLFIRKNVPKFKKKKNHQKESKKKETKDPFELINCHPFCIVNRCIYYCVYSNISRFVILVLVHIYFGIKRALILWYSHFIKWETRP